MKKSNVEIICTLAFVALVSVAVTTLLGALLEGSLFFNIIDTPMVKTSRINNINFF